MIGFHTHGESTDQIRLEGATSGLAQRYRKELPASRLAGHQTKLTALYTNAVELGGGTLVGAGGGTTTFGLIAGTISQRILPPTDWAGLWDMLLNSSPIEMVGLAIGTVFAVLAPWALFLIGIYFEMFSASERPIYLDRARQKMYYVHQGRKRFFLFGAPKVEARSVDWSLVDGEMHTKLVGGVNSMRREPYLVLLIRTSDTDPTIADSIVLSHLDVVGAMWEYMRCYMNGTMAPLDFDEKVPPLKGEPFDLWRELRQATWKRYWQQWKEAPGRQAVNVLLLPLFLVYIPVNRLVVWTAQKVTWPQEIKDALGPQVTEDDVARDTEHKLRSVDPALPKESKMPREKRLTKSELAKYRGGHLK